MMPTDEQRSRDRKTGRGIVALALIVLGIVVVSGIVAAVSNYTSARNLERAKAAVRADEERAFQESVKKALEPKPSQSK